MPKGVLWRNWRMASQALMVLKPMMKEMKRIMTTHIVPALFSLRIVPRVVKG